MATISIASAKGGCGKTTVAILIGTYLSQSGYEVTLLDCDINQHATAFGEKANLENFHVKPSIDEFNILSSLRDAEKVSDVVFIDLPGGSSTLALKALQRSNYVLVPCQTSLPDVKDAMKTIAQIDDAEDLARVKIAYSLIWTRIFPGFESKSAKHVRTSIEKQNIPLFKNGIVERAAFREIHLTGQIPHQKDPDSKASLDVANISNELLENLEKLAGE